jgi:hypothetical protein
MRALCARSDDETDERLVAATESQCHVLRATEIDVDARRIKLARYANSRVRKDRLNSYAAASDRDKWHPFGCIVGPPDPRPILIYYGGPRQTRSAVLVYRP